MAPAKKPFPWLALLLLAVSVGAFWGLPKLWPQEAVNVTFEGQAK